MNAGFPTVRGAPRHGLPLALALILALAAIGPLQADPPRLMESLPPDGASDLDPDLGELILTFDQDMDPGSWSLLEVEGRPFPPLLDLGGGSPWLDARSFFLPLDRLQPDTDYGVQLNSRHRQGFRNRAGEPLAPVQVRFRTGGAAPLDQTPVPESEANGAPRTRPTGPSPEPPSPGGTASAPGTLVFTKVTEPRQQAFTLLVPQGWQVEGGVFLVDPTQAGGAANAIESKVDFKAKRDAAGSVLLWRLPDWYYADVRHTPAGQMGLFPEGSNYGGMTVRRLMSAEEFLLQVVIPQAHPGARGLQVLERRDLSRFVQTYRQRAASLALPMDFEFDAALVTVAYEDGGIRYKEVLYTLIENRGPLVAGQWANRDTLLIRAPEGEFPRWEPVLGLMVRSVRLSPQWLVRELQGVAQRGGTYLGTLQEINRIGQEITEHRQRTNAEIHNDMFLTLTGQEEYLNPHTGEVEVGSGELGRYRWETAGGDVFYSDREDLDPSISGILNRTDWKRSPVRPRFGQ